MKRPRPRLPAAPIAEPTDAPHAGPARAGKATAAWELPPESVLPALSLRRRKVALRALALVGVLLAAAGAIVVTSAWRETVRREAYLPDLEAEARRSPNDGRLLALLGARLAQAGDRTAAAAFERAVSAGADGAPVWLAWAASEAAAGDVARAEAVLRTGMTMSSAAHPKLEAARDRLRRVNPGSSPSTRAAAISPDGGRVLLRAYASGSFLNGFAEWRGRRDPVRSGLVTRERWAREEPENVAVQVLWARALMTNRRLPQAAIVLRQVLERNPDSAEAHLAAGDVLLKDGAVGAADREYRTCLRLRPDWLPALVGLGNVAVEQQNASAGIELFTKATRQAPKSADAWVGLGRAYYRQYYRLREATDAFGTAARLAPQRTDFFTDYADALRSAGQMDTAESLTRRRLKEEPRDAHAIWLLSVLLIDHRPSAARSAEAERLLRDALPVVMNRRLIAVRLGQLLLDNGDAKAAVELLKPVADGAPDREGTQAVSLLAQAYRKLGRLAEAKAAQERVAWLAEYRTARKQLMDQTLRDPKNSRAHRDIARLLRTGGETELAGQHLETAAAIEAQRKTARGGTRPGAAVTK